MRALVGTRLTATSLRLRKGRQDELTLLDAHMEAGAVPTQLIFVRVCCWLKCSAGGYGCAMLVIGLRVCVWRQQSECAGAVLLDFAMNKRDLQ